MGNQAILNRDLAAGIYVAPIKIDKNDENESIQPITISKNKRKSYDM